MNRNMEPYQRLEVAGSDVLDAVEAECAGHAAFGDTHGILDRFHAVSLLRLDAISRCGIPLLRELCHELQKGRNRREGADVLKDPVVLGEFSDLLDSTRRSRRRPSDETEEIFVAVLHHLRTGRPGPPVAAGCVLRFRPNAATPPIPLWDPTGPQSIVQRRFASKVNATLSVHFPGRGHILGHPTPAFAKALKRGYHLLAILLPALSASVLAHVRVIGVFNEGKWGLKSLTSPRIASTFFITPGTLNTSWEMAETLLHEALHNKLMDIITLRSGFRPVVESRLPTVRAIWNRERPGSSTAWPLSHAFRVFHVYVHLALFFAKVRTMDVSLADDFGTPPAFFEHRLERVLSRAGYLGQELTASGDRFLDRDGRALFAWLRQMLSRLCDADALQAQVERLREKAKRAESLFT